MNWSIWEYEQVRAGDEFYILKVGGGATGIVSTGLLTSEPYISGDWSGQGRKVYYCDYTAKLMLNPETMPILTSAALQEEIPDFDWQRGHSGAVLTPEQSQSFRTVWASYLNTAVPEFYRRLDFIDQRQLDNDQLYIDTDEYQPPSA